MSKKSILLINMKLKMYPLCKNNIDTVKKLINLKNNE